MRWLTGRKDQKKDPNSSSVRIDTNQSVVKGTDR